MKKKIILTLAIALVVAVGALALVGCSQGFNPDNKITIISREDGSGTRSGFDDIVGIKGDVVLSPSAIIQNTTGAVMGKVNVGLSAIGYISLGSYNDTVKMVKVNGVTPSAATVQDSTYALQRNFNLVTKEGTTMSAAATDFMNYINSSKGQKVVADNKYVKIGEGSAYATAKNTVTGTLQISGSSSVSPLMEKLKKAYADEQSGVKITVISNDSGTGVSDVKSASSDAAPNVIGMISREKKSTETGIVSTKIAIDGIAIIVNNKNTIENLTIDQIRDIFTGKITKFSEVISA